MQKRDAISVGAVSPSICRQDQPSQDERSRAQEIVDGEVEVALPSTTGYVIMSRHCLSDYAALIGTTDLARVQQWVKDRNIALDEEIERHSRTLGGFLPATPPRKHHVANAPVGLQGTPTRSAPQPATRWAPTPPTANSEEGQSWNSFTPVFDDGGFHVRVPPVKTMHSLTPSEHVKSSLHPRGTLPDVMHHETTRLYGTQAYSQSVGVGNMTYPGNSSRHTSGQWGATYNDEHHEHDKYSHHDSHQEPRGLDARQHRDGLLERSGAAMHKPPNLTIRDIPDLSTRSSVRHVDTHENWALHKRPDLAVATPSRSFEVISPGSLMHTITHGDACAEADAIHPENISVSLSNSQARDLRALAVADYAVLPLRPRSRAAMQNMHLQQIRQGSHGEGQGISLIPSEPFASKAYHIRSLVRSFLCNKNHLSSKGPVDEGGPNLREELSGSALEDLIDIFERGEFPRLRRAITRSDFESAVLSVVPSMSGDDIGSLITALRLEDSSGHINYHRFITFVASPSL